ncbi:DUF6479 family protein [Streptomyces chromofuscus]|uniref:Secreted protein n=1 Tax=Streptomyces chromofuscus TaxID=42881 RepID=A0A7M2T6W2_STRCW|nr:DUF6479 family protein [Streptomyces chromofuscus]QOV44427.1 hypothetical protein IPT68_33250 [Streptomyces chromofuscus]GGT22644.1 hypothetical protein GCM10010254_48820 [Streptomyces chromofuscus]
MNLTAYEAAAAGSVAGFVAVLVGGLVVTATLIWAVLLGIKVRKREPRRPRPDEQPRLPASGAVRETREQREPNAITGDDRLTPHDLRPSGGARSGDQRRPRWNRGSSGSFGSGGPGGA